MHKLLIEVLCQVGLLAETACRKWSGGDSGIETIGAEFVLSYELAKHLDDNRERLGIAKLGFNLALREIGAFEKGFLRGRMAGRNTKRRYFVLYHTDGTRSVIRAQQYFDMGILHSEAKGIARALDRHPEIHTALIFGIASFSDNISPEKPLSNLATQLRCEFSSEVQTGFRFARKEDLEGVYVFVILCQHQRETVIDRP